MQNPEKILGPYFSPSMWVLEIGPGMGFFTLPMAGMVHKEGKIVCIDLQEKMIAALKKRAVKAGCAPRMEFRVCTADSLCIDDLQGTVDFALAVAVVHEVPDPRRFFTEIFLALKKGGSLLFSEPAGHVTRDAFAGSISLARSVGFEIRDTRRVLRNHSALLVK
jgi:ubiquinone/menaquinone biosynthesis C-methylase UbiE